MESVFETHYWPATGRVLMIHIPNFGVAAGEPLLTELHITDSGTISLADTTHIVAKVLADAGSPSGGIVEHAPNGTVRVIRVQSTTYRDEVNA